MPESRLTVNLEDVELVMACECGTAYIVAKPESSAVVPLCFNCAGGSQSDDTNRTEVVAAYRRFLQAVREASSRTAALTVRLQVPSGA